MESSTARNGVAEDIDVLGRELLDTDPERGVAVLTLDRKVVYANRAAHTLLRDGSPRGPLGLLPASMEEWLGQFIDRMADAPGPIATEMAYPHDDDRRLRVTFESRPDGKRPLVVLRAYPATPWLEPSVRRLQARFGLTMREAQATAGVAAGQTNKEVAEQLGIREKTVKNVLMSVFSKCTVRNRVELALRAYEAPVGSLEPRV